MLHDGVDFREVSVEVVDKIDDALTYLSDLQGVCVITEPVVHVQTRGQNRADGVAHDGLFEWRDGQLGAGVLATAAVTSFAAVTTTATVALADDMRLDMVGRKRTKILQERVWLVILGGRLLLKGAMLLPIVVMIANSCIAIELICR